MPAVNNVNMIHSTRLCPFCIRTYCALLPPFNTELFGVFLVPILFLYYLI